MRDSLKFFLLLLFGIVCPIMGEYMVSASAQYLVLNSFNYDQEGSL